MIEVYHLNDQDFFKDDEVIVRHDQVDPRYYDANLGFRKERQTAAVIELFNEGHYTLVAKIDTDSLDKAWHHTNHIDDCWTTNKDSYSLVENPRSSKVGDIMKDDNGKYHIVASIGFNEIPDGVLKEPSQVKKVKM